MIRLRVESDTGLRALCSQEMRGELARWVCGLCTRGQVAPWLGFRCTDCKAVVIEAGADTPTEALVIERYLFECLRRTGAKMSTGEAAARQLSAIVQRHNSGRRAG